MTRSQLGFFVAGLAAGALAREAYPRVKDALAPFLAGASQAFDEAVRDVAESVESMRASVVADSEPDLGRSEVAA